MRGQRQAGLELGQRDAGEEDAGVGERRVLERANPEAGGVAVDGAGEVVGIEVQVERVGNQAEAPDGRAAARSGGREIWARAGE